ncbi:MAG TPA: DNA mismatch repair protein MutS, partial [Thermoanaerobaculia bacterium]|nr:DNA mismatch repair protein MutS [Thermoanaerobaculia bacterium]
MRSTPMLDQYGLLKQEAGDAILLYRLGDFYEMFFEDAEVAAPLLGLVLTARHKDSDIEAPMCGVPHHALDAYVAKLVTAGKKVAIAEQTEAPGKGKTIVARKIVRILTPGTIVDPERLDARRPSELAGATAGALAFLDVSTGEFTAVPLENGTSAAEILGRRLPKEVVAFPSEADAVRGWLDGLVPEAPVLSVLSSESPRGRSAADVLLRHFGTSTLEAFGLPESGAAVDAAAALLQYAKTTQRSECAHVLSLRTERPDEGLVVDAVTAGHLELFRSQRDGGRKGSLLDVLDRTSTSFGARALRRMLERPLSRIEPIEARLHAIEELLEEPARLE